MQYEHKSIEDKWQAEWRKRGTYQVSEDPARPKYYVLDMFPYPSGAGLHVGHPLGYIASDIVARYKRHKGFNVLHPMGYDSFGLPAEQYAIQTGQHPAKTTEVNLARYREQLDRIGFSFDWSREVRTSDPAYYKWTQWIFLQLFDSWYDPEQDKARPISELMARFEERGCKGQDAAVLTGDVEEFMGEFDAAEWQAFDERTRQRILQHFRLAYLSDAWVNWCPALGTVLANDEVKDGVSERGGHPVERKRMPQWSLRITAYAQRLLDGLDTLDWSESIKEAQRNWIGRSEGALVRFAVKPGVPLTPGPSPGERGASAPAWAERPGYLTADQRSAGRLQRYAREHRKEPTEAEEKLWQQIRGKATGGRIRRQHVIDRYIVDFVSLPKRLVIEVDGGIHEKTRAADAARTERLKELGFDVIRFTNEEVLVDMPRVVEAIKTELRSRPDVTAKGNSPSPSEGAVDSEGTSATSSGSRVDFEGTSSSPSGSRVDFKGTSPSPSERGPGGEGHSPQRPPAYAHPTIEVFTTRPDTLFGVTFVTLAPEHELVEQITTGEQRAEVMAYVAEARNRSERERQADVKRVSGAFTGAYVEHPFTGEDIPVWVGDYVLAGYGTGAVMAVPGGDQRDWNFATHFGLPIIAVTEGADITQGADESKEGVICSEGFLKGLPVKEAITRAIAELEERDAGERRINFRLRDAAFGRQRYWGEPIPVYYKDDVPYPLPESELPLKLPEVDKFLPTEDGEPPLARATDWNYQGHPLETTTMPGWAGSSWYFLRYMDPHNAERFASPEAIAYWQQIDLYMGGSEHATGHLLYFRFWTKFLHDRGWLPFDEPAKKLVNQGMIQGVSALLFRVPLEFVDDPFQENPTEKPSAFIDTDLRDEYRASKGQFELPSSSAIIEQLSTIQQTLAKGTIDVSKTLGLMKHPHPSRAVFVPIDCIEEGSNSRIDIEKLRRCNDEFASAHYVLSNGELHSWRQTDKMSKSKYNVVNPDDIIAKYGADTLRLYEMFLGPLEQSKPWDTNGIEGTFRFLKKFWNLFHQGGESGKGGERGEKGAAGADEQRSGDAPVASTHRVDLPTVTNEAPTKAELKILHATLKKVTEDIERMSFNTSVSQFMIAANELGSIWSNAPSQGSGARGKRAVLEPLVIALAPFAPHIAEELWEKLGHADSVTGAPWPQWEAQYLVEDNFSYPISFNGKTRLQLEFPIALSKEEVEAAVLANPEVQARLEGKAPKKVIVVPKRIVNIVV